MFEIMLFGRFKAVPFYPDSGPGPKYLLVGTPDKGYFGSLTAAELGVSAGLAELLYSTTSGGGFDFSNYVNWDKYYYNNKVLYIPTGACGRVSYAELEAVKATYSATNELKPIILPISGQSMYAENALVSGSESSILRVRLANAAVNSTTVESTVPYTALANTELGDLWLSRYAGVGVSNPFGLSVRNMNEGRVFSASVSPAEVMNSTSLAGFFATTPGASTSATALSPTALQAWRPVLELVPYAKKDLVLAPVSAITYTSDVKEILPRTYAKQISLYPPAVIYATDDRAPSDYQAISTLMSLPPAVEVIPGGVSSDFLTIY